MKRKLETKKVLLSELKEFPGNPNVHPEEQVKAIAESMERYGQYYPIIVDENMMVLCGHGKKKALEYRGEKEASITVMYGLTDKEKKKLVLEDNKIQTMSHVNFGDMEKIIKEIGDVDIIGFTPEYLDAIINEVSSDNMGTLPNLLKRSSSLHRRKRLLTFKRWMILKPECRLPELWCVRIVVRR